MNDIETYYNSKLFSFTFLDNTKTMVVLLLSYSIPNFHCVLAWYRKQGQKF